MLNGLFEFSSALLILTNVRQLIKDKRVAGINLWTTTLFDLWGVWNLYYYGHLNQFFSLPASAFLTAGNTWWTALAFYYTAQRRRFRLPCVHGHLTCSECAVEQLYA